MASLQKSQFQHDHQVEGDTQLCFVSGSKFETKKITDLSRNVLIIVCEYLAFSQIVSLTCSNKKILNKLDNFLENSREVSYFKRRAIIFFQSFFFQQFPSTDIFIKRMSSITSCSTMASSSFLPLTKQSSINIDKKSTMPQLQYTSSYNPFDIAIDLKTQHYLNTNIMEKLEDQKSSNYIEETYIKWRGLYNKALQNKYRFVQISKNEFYSAFVQNPEDYAREIFLDPSQCENPCFVLPQLTRENFTQKGLFYRTEKVLVQNYYNCFQKYSVDYTKKLLWDINQEMQTQLSQNLPSQTLLKKLLFEEALEGETLPIGYNSQVISDTNQTNTLLPPQLNTTQNTPLQENLDMDESDDLSQLELALASLQNLQRGTSKPSAQYDYIDFGISKIAATTGGEENISQLYKDITSYTLRQYKLICYAHKSQLDFILQQIQMAPSVRQNYYIYIEDYVMKERNLRYLFRKISQNFIVQEAFSETMMRNSVFQEPETQKHPYLCDFLLLEYMDSIWINEIYRPHSYNLIQIVQQEIQNAHTLEKFEELQEKKEIFRKIINIIHQTEFNLHSNSSFLSISHGGSRYSGKFLSEYNFVSGVSDDQGSATLTNYEQMSNHIRKSVRQLLKQMQQKAQTVDEFMQLATTYEGFQFHKLQEIECFYFVTKKYYLGKAFAHELGMKLENNKFAKTQNNQHPGFTIDLNFNQVIPSDLIDSFFHQVLRKLTGEENFKKYMDSESLIQSLFVLFHIDQVSKSNFAGEINQHLTECHSQIEELLQQQPELATQMDTQEESKETLNSTDPSITNQQCPFTLIASDEDDDFLCQTMQQPDLSRGYSDQKKQYQKGLRRSILKVFLEVESQFDFKNLIVQRRLSDNKRMMDEIQQRIDNFNQAMMPFNTQNQDTDLDNIEDEDMLPDPSSLMTAFTGGLNLPSLNRSNNSYNYHISSSNSDQYTKNL